MASRVLYCGDTQFETITSAKGVDTFTHHYFLDGSRVLRSAFEAEGIECVHMPAHEITTRFPETSDELSGSYDVVVISDVGYNNFTLLAPYNRSPARVPLGPNRATVLHDFVKAGGGLIMCGGWLTFSGLNATGLYSGTVIEDVLPVTCLPGLDDRVEVPEGIRLTLNIPSHPIVQGLPWDDSYLVVGYNRVRPRPSAVVVASFGDDPALAIGMYGNGRSVAYTTDPAPHWSGTFMDWSGYSRFWGRIVKWAAGTFPSGDETTDTVSTASITR